MVCDAEEGTDGEVEEDGGDDGVEDEAVVGWTGEPACAEPPEVSGEEEGEDGEEEAGHFEPEGAGGVGEGFPDGEAEVS